MADEKRIRLTKYTFLFITIVFVGLTGLRFADKISETEYVAIVVAMLGAIGIFQRVNGYYLQTASRAAKSLNKKVVTASIILFGMGTALMLEKVVDYEAIITFPPTPFDHGLYGLIMVIISAIVLTRINGSYWWEKCVRSSGHA